MKNQYRIKVVTSEIGSVYIPQYKGKLRERHYENLGWETTILEWILLFFISIGSLGLFPLWYYVDDRYIWKTMENKYKSKYSCSKETVALGLINNFKENDEKAIEDESIRKKEKKIKNIKYIEVE